MGENVSTYWESWFSRIGPNVRLLDVHDRFQVIKIFHLFLYSIEIYLFKQVLWDRIWSRTIGELNLNWTMPKILKLQKLCLEEDVPVGCTYRRRKNILSKPSHIGTKYRQWNKFSKLPHFLNVNCSGTL